LAVVRVTEHVAVFVPAQAPPQPRKAFPGAVVAVSVTFAPDLKRCVHVFRGPAALHLPAELETLPRPETTSVSVPPAALPAENAAVTLLAELIVTVHVLAVPVQEPPQPVKVAPVAGVAVSVTTVPEATETLQVEAPFPQLIPPPETLPAPVTATDSWKLDVPPENVAVTDFAALNVTVHVVAVPVQEPPQPVKVAPGPGVAVRIAVEFAAWLALEHVELPRPQLIPPPVMLPFPLTETLSVKPLVGGGVGVDATTLKVAFTDRAWLIRTVQVVAVPPQAPVQPRNVAPVAGVATSETDAFTAKPAAQIVPPLPQLIAPEPPVTAPLPATSTASAGPNVAVTATSAVPIVTLHVPVPAHPPPDQPVRM
jgi:hypothetical protein